MITCMFTRGRGLSYMSQGGAGRLGDEMIGALHTIGSRDLYPDVTVLIDVPPQQIANRLAERDGNVSDAIGGRGADYHRAVARSFAKLAEEDPDRFVIVDGLGSIDEVQTRVWTAISEKTGVAL